MADALTPNDPFYHGTNPAQAAQSCGAGCNANSDAAKAAAWSGTITSNKGVQETYNPTQLVYFNGIQAPQALITHYFAGPSDPFYEAASATLRAHLNNAAITMGREPTYDYRPSPSVNENIPGTGNVINPATGLYHADESWKAQNPLEPKTVKVAELPAPYKSTPVSPQEAGTWGKGEQYVPYLGQAAVDQINAGLVVSKQMADAAFAMPAPYRSVSSPRAAEYSTLSIAAVAAAPAVLYGYASALQQGISGATDVGYGAVAPLPKFVSVPLNAAVGAGGAIASTIPFAMSIPFGAQYAVSHPAEVPEKAIEMVSKMATDAFERELKSPGSVAGTMVGMYIGGKALGYAGGKAAEYSPVDVDLLTRVPTGEGGYNTYNTISVKNPLATMPESKFIGGVAYGEDIPGIKAFTGSPAKVAAETNVGITDLFNVRDVSKTPSAAQMRITDPLLRTAAKGTPNEPIVNALLDIKKALPASERTLQYTTESPVGSFRQAGTTPAIKAQVFETLADSQSRFVGSQALGDVLGKNYIRDVSRSDIDISMPSQYIAGSREAIQKIYSQNPVSEIKLARAREGYSFRDVSTGEKPLGVHPAENFPDVRTFTGYTESGKAIKIQTPEYSIESKASRLFKDDTSFIKYSPESGVDVSLGGGKVSTDIADMYAASRGISKVAYEQGRPELGRTYEGISNNIRSYGERTGKGEVISTIKRDILKDASTGPKEVGRMYSGYPVSISTGEFASARFIPYIPIQPGYPAGISQQGKGVAGIPQYPPGLIGKEKAQPIAAYPHSNQAGNNYPGSVSSRQPTITPSNPTQYPPSTPIIPEAPYPPSVPVSPISPVSPPSTPAQAIVFKNAGFSGPFQPAIGPARGIPVPQLIPSLQSEYPPHRVKTRRQKGKRFAEVFSFDVFKGMKVPGRLYTKNFESTAGGKGKRFQEVFSMATKPLPKIPDVPVPGTHLRRMKSRKP